MPVLDNKRHERFAQLLADGWAVGKAYVEAGYEEHVSNPTRLSEDERIKERVTELLETDAHAARLTKAWVVQKLMQNVERAMQSTPVLDNEGQPTGDYVYNGAAANGALKILAQHVGLLTEQQARDSGKSETTINIRLVDKEPARAEAEQRVAALRKVG